jgi:peptide/nickel transport system substrate-binding protein
MRTSHAKVWLAFVVMLGCAVIHGGDADRLDASPTGVLKGAIHWAPSADWLDPSLPSSGQSGLFCLYLFHDALLKPMPQGQQTPGLAESWTISSDYKVYEFKLRRGVKFHNGDEMTAEDVVFSISRYKGGAAKAVKDRIEKVEAVNPYLVRISFKTNFPNFFDYFITGECTIGWIVPKKYIEKVGDAEYKNNPIGCGPYKFIEYKPDGRIVGEAFENYWRKKPNIKRMEFNIVRETSTRYAMLKRGEIDIATLMTDMFFDRVKKDPELRLVTPESPTVYIAYITSQWDPKSPWSDPRVRKAASLALDRQSLADVHMPGVRLAGSLGLSGASEGLDLPPDPYDPERAKRLLAEAGYPRGFNGGPFYPWDSGYWPFGEQVAGYWRAVGIRTETVLLDRAAHLSNRRAGKMKGGTFIESMNQPTLGTRLEWLLGAGSYGSYDDIKGLWAQYNKEYNLKKRKDLIEQIEKLMYDRTMTIPILTGNSPTGLGPRIKGNPYKIQKPYPMWFMAPFEDIELNS